MNCKHSEAQRLYWREWNKAHRAEISRKENERYQNDPEYRARKKQQSRDSARRRAAKVCARVAEYRALNPEKVKALQNRTNEKRLEQRLKCIEYKGGKCSRCGYDAHHAAMQFHHIDPSTKAYEISVALGWNWSVDTLRQELDKCVLLCANCHRIVEWEKKWLTKQETSQ